MWANFDPGPFDPKNTDEQKIKNKIPVPCRLCESAFLRLRPTLRYCAICKHGFCEGEHGNFSLQRIARCVQCGPHVKDSH